MNLLIHDIAAAIERDANEGEPRLTRVDHSVSARGDTWADEWRERMSEPPFEPRRRMRPRDH